MVELPAVEYKPLEKDGLLYLTIRIPDDLRDQVEYELASLKTAQVYARLGKPKKPRSTGKGSQSAHFHGHCLTISLALSLPFDMVKMAIKIMAMEAEYPGVSVAGIKIPMSESDASTEHETILIETAHKFAAEHSIMLIENEPEIVSKPKGWYTMTDDEKRLTDPARFDEEKQLDIF